MGFSKWGRRLAGIFGRDRAASELEEEMRLHMELRARQLRQQGLAADEAGYAARRRFGNELAVHDASARVWGWSAWERLLGDFRHAFRGLRKAPGFTAVAIATLAVGLGMNVAVFSLVNAVMLRSLPYAEPGRLVSLWEETFKGEPSQFSTSGAPLGGQAAAERTTVAPANLADYARSAAFDDLASFDGAAKNLTGLGTPERLEGEAVSANFFDVLGVKPALGRSFLPEEDRDGAAARVIVTDRFWRDRLGADTDVLTRSIALDAQQYQIVGVLPKGFQSPRQLTTPDRVEIYVPAAYPKDLLAHRGDHDVNAVARLRPGVSVRQAQADLDVISANLGKQFPGTNRNIRAAIAPLRDDIARNVRQSLWILLSASALIVLIACVNLANLMLVRAARRQHESSVRMALGGGRWSLVRQYLAESLTLAGAGCAAGLAVGFVFMRVLVWLAPQNIPRIQNVEHGLAGLRGGGRGGPGNGPGIWCGAGVASVAGQSGGSAEDFRPQHGGARAGALALGADRGGDCVVADPAGGRRAVAAQLCTGDGRGSGISAGAGISGGHQSARTAVQRRGPAPQFLRRAGTPCDGIARSRGGSLRQPFAAARRLGIRNHIRKRARCDA